MLLDGRVLVPARIELASSRVVVAWTNGRSEDCEGGSGCVVSFGDQGSGRRGGGQVSRPGYKTGAKARGTAGLRRTEDGKEIGGTMKVVPIVRASAEVGGKGRKGGRGY